MSLTAYRAATGLSVSISSTSYPGAQMFSTGTQFHAAKESTAAPQYAFNKQTGEWVEIDPEQAWFWTDEWQEGEREADEDFRLGRVEEFDNVDDFIDSL